MTKMFTYQGKRLKTWNPLPFPDNVYHGVTLETNRLTRLTPMSKAPSPLQRYQIMTLDEHPHKFVSIEPVMDFDLIEFSNWIYDISPEIVEIGVDNYNNNLPEPSGDKVRKLIDILTLHGVNVIQKQGLERLLPRGEHTDRDYQSPLHGHGSSADWIGR